MGKGDRSSRRGKIFRGSHGNKRPKARNAQRTPEASPGVK